MAAIRFCGLAVIAREMNGVAIQALRPFGHMVEQTRHYRPRHKVVAIHKSIGGTRGPGDTTAKSLVAHGPWEVPVELWIARQQRYGLFFTGREKTE
jgi:hypothetical protein